eukprot:scaffold163224_cov34-Tisochrysis_lutea.AAC.3
MTVAEFMSIRNSDCTSVRAKGDGCANHFGHRQLAAIVAGCQTEALRIELLLWRGRARVRADKVVQHRKHQDDIHQRHAAPATSVYAISGETANKGMDVVNCSRVVILRYPAQAR